MWSNGDPVTAQDFVYAWQRAVDPATASPYSWFVELAAIENASEIIAGEAEPDTLGVEAVDERTLKVTLTEPTPYFPDMTTHATLFPAHRATIEEHGADWTDPENFVGNGAYVLEELVPNEYTRIVKSDSYWNAEDVILEEVTFHVVNEDNQALTRYLAGELDHLEPVPAGRFPELQDEYPDQATVVPRLCSYYYALNQSEQGPEALRDPRVRTALALAIDRGVIVDQVLQGGQGPAYFFAHPATAGYEPPQIPYAEMTQAERDEEANRLLEEARADGVVPEDGLDLEITYNTSEAHQQVATVVSQMWKQKLGVDTTLSNYEWQTYLDRTDNQQFEVARAGWCGDYNEASTFLDLLDLEQRATTTGKFIPTPSTTQLLARGARGRGPDPHLPPGRAAPVGGDGDHPDLPLHAELHARPEQIEGWPYENVENNWYAKDLYRVADQG